MKIFNRGNDAKAAPAGPAAAVAAPAAPAPAPEAHAPPAPAQPDLTAILDANVKEMSEKIARLTSNLEDKQQERVGFEQKLEQMEDRMRKLSALTEMISAQYNPFVGDAPSERDPLPAPEVGLAAAVTLPPPPDAAPAPAPLGPTADFAAGPAPLVSLVEPAYDHAEAPGPQPAAPATLATPVAMPAYAHEPEEPQGVHLWSVHPGFESSMLLLSWADMLLKNAGERDSVATLIHYYHNIGWIGDPARDQLLAYVDGIAAPAATGSAADWRADTDVHERSLLFVEKLKAAARRAR